MAPVKVLFCGTHPSQYNGYSKVVYELAVKLAGYKDIQLTVWGFQNAYDHVQHKRERDLPAHVTVYDALANEEPKNKGFGESQIVEYVKKTKPDIVIVYNDLAVLTVFMTNLCTIPDRTFKIVPYIDLVYQSQNDKMLRYIHDKSDAGIFFTKHWEAEAKRLGFTKPTYVLEHGFNPQNYYPIPRKVARAFFGIPETDFVFTNLNRNQPRKRWDLCMMAVVRFISRHIGSPVRMLIATALQGAWDLVEIFQHECRKHGLAFEEAKQHLIIVDSPQNWTDREINILYSAADVGINTCDGEGFGLCNFEQAAVGVPQIVPRLGGFLDFFDDSTALLVAPTASIYVDQSHAGVGGEAELCHPDHIADAMERYYADDDLRQLHGKNAREKILRDYKWSDKAKQLYDAIVDQCKDKMPKSSEEVKKKNTHLTFDLQKPVSTKDAVEKIKAMTQTQQPTATSAQANDVSISSVIHPPSVSHALATPTPETTPCTNQDPTPSTNHQITDNVFESVQVVKKPSQDDTIKELMEMNKKLLALLEAKLH
jgi:glycosyltransferase involved in cell wall biosynthesis